MNLPLSHLFFESPTPSDKLMIILHGRGDAAEGFRFFPQELGFDDMNYLLLNAPTAYFTGYSWYDFPPNQLEGILESRELLTQTLDTVFKDKFTPSKTILFGFSQGSLLTFEFGARYKQKLAGYFGISGYIFDATTIAKEAHEDVKTLPWYCTHGYEDEILPFEESQTQVKELQVAGFNITFKPYHKTHTISMEELGDLREWIKEIKDKM